MISRFRVLRQFLRRPLGVVSAVFLLIVIVAVALAKVVAPYSPLAQDYSAVLITPTAAHPLGTDQLGRDVLSRLLYGGQVTLVGILEAVVVAVVIGIILGLLAGYLGGVLDTVLSRLTELVMAIPGIVVLLMTYALTNNNANAGMLVLGFLSVPTIYRVTRGAASAVRDETFISASRVVGIGRIAIMARHVLPNVWGPIIVNASVLAAVTLGIQSGLNYLSLGVNPPAPSWGGMVSEAQSSLLQQPWLIVPSGFTIALVIVAFLLVADALRDATDTRSDVPAVAPAPAAVEDQDAPVGAAPAGSLLAVDHLRVAFNDLRVVQDVRFSVAAGETVGIVGESGSGKTVTASAILDSLDPGARVTGSVWYRGVDLLRASKRVRGATRGSGIAYISQDPMVALDPSFTVASQLGELVARHHGLRGAARNKRVLELLGQVGLPDPAGVARRYAHQLSGGMAQRVSIACALAGDPKVLIADEPTTALDVTIQGEILDLLRRLRDETGMAIVIITHDLGVIADIADRVVVMYAGEVVEEADAQTLFANPAHPYTRALLAANPIASKRGVPLVAIAGTVPRPGTWPTGCHFAARCAFAVAACSAAAIQLEPIGEPGVHDARCIRIDEVLSSKKKAVAQ
jgi:peptide/nickel transport system permease protein